MIPPFSHPSFLLLFHTECVSRLSVLLQQYISNLSFLCHCCSALVHITASSCQQHCSNFLTGLLASSLVPTLVLHGSSCPLPAGTLQGLPIISDWHSESVLPPLIGPACSGSRSTLQPKPIPLSPCLLRTSHTDCLSFSQKRHLSPCLRTFALSFCLLAVSFHLPFIP